MLNKKEILKEIKRLMKFGHTEEGMNYIDAKSGENIVRVEGEDFVVGADVFVVTPEGVIPAPDGEHILEDGRTLVVGGGKITEVKEAVVETENEGEVEINLEEITPEEKKQEEVSALKKMEDAEKKIEEMEKKILDMEEVISEMVKAYGNVGKFTSEVQTKLNDFVKNTPAEQHFSSLKSEYKSMIKERKTTEMNSLDKLREIRLKK
jgi:hypothetical protein